MSVIQHSSQTDRWFTPTWLVEASRTVLGGIDLDPASEAAANERIKATHFLSEFGASRVWPENAYKSVFINPPGGKVANRSQTLIFWERLMREVADEQFGHAIFVCFSIEALQTSQATGSPMTNWPFCIPKKRIRFARPDGSPGGSPSHANAIIYVPCNMDHSEHFEDVFSSHGAVVRPYR